MQENKIDVNLILSLAALTISVLLVTSIVLEKNGYFKIVDSKVTSRIVQAQQNNPIQTVTNNQNITNAASQFAAKVQASQNRFEVKYDIPEYLGEELQKPQRFFAGRPLKIQEITSKKTLSSPQNVKIKRITGGIPIQENSKIQNVTKKRRNYFTFNTDNNIGRGQYVIEFAVEGQLFQLPVNLSYEPSNYSVTSTQSIAQTTQLFPGATIGRLNCEWCFWESVSIISELNEDYGYLIGGVPSFVQTKDGWKTSEIYNIEDLTLSPKRNYRGDPILTLKSDGGVSLTSLAWIPSEPTTGVFYSENSPLSFPIQFTQIDIESLPSDGSVNFSNIGLIMDRPETSIDRNPNSPYYGNTYIFANAVRDDQFNNTGQGLFILNKTRGIIKKFRGIDYLVSSTVIGPNGQLYGGMMYADKLLVSKDGGITLNKVNFPEDNYFPSCPARVSTTSNKADGIYQGPELAINSKGVLFAVWSVPKECKSDPLFEYPNYGYDFDILFSSSYNEGLTWTQPIKVNSDNSGGDQFFPDIAVDKEGTIYVAYLDRRDNQDKGLYNIYVAISYDGGKIFSRDIKVNDIPVVNELGMREPGDYLDMINVGPTRIFITYPCMNENFPIVDRANDACVTVINKSALPKISPCSSYGDADLDNYVTEKDSNLVLDYDAGLATLTQEQKIRADVDRDGAVNVIDGNFILQYIKGLTDTFPVCQKYWTINRSTLSDGWKISVNDLYNLHDVGNSIKVKGENVYIAGIVSNSRNKDILIAKFNLTGDLVWDASYNSIYDMEDEAKDIAVDSSGNVYV
ncbi:MAG: hypothetical protein AABX51_04670, partial [Nanoarchaeota archaeon]